MALNRSIILIFFPGFLTIGCGQELALNESPAIVSATEAITFQKEISTEADSMSPTTVRRIIRDGELRWQTTDSKQTLELISEHVEQVNGFVANDQQHRSEGYFEQTLVIRIPSDNFDQFVAVIDDNVKHFDIRQFDSRDVTEEFIDLEARLAVKRDLESRYRELLTKAKSVEDVLKVEQQLASVRTDIESVEGRLKYLRNQVAFSTLRISYYQQDAAVSGFGTRLSENFGMGWKAVVEFGLAMVVAWPFWLFLCIVVWVIRRLILASKSRVTATVGR